jgi:hypothetical protein
MDENNYIIKHENKRTIVGDVEVGTGKLYLKEMRLNEKNSLNDCKIITV